MVTDSQLDALDRLARGAVGLTAASLVVGDRADLTIAQWRGLAVVADRAPDPTRVGEVAARLGMSLPSASRLVRRLERHELVTSARDETDRRVTLVTATPSGLELHEAVVRHRRETMAGLLRDRRLPGDLGGGLSAIADAFDGLD